MKLQTAVKDNTIHVCKDQDKTVCGLYHDGMRVTPILSTSGLMSYTDYDGNNDELCEACLVWELITEW